MTKKILLISIFGIINSTVFAYDLPTIAVPNLIYTKIDKTPVTTTNTEGTITTVIKQTVERQLPMFTADIRGALINSKKFKVINLPKANTLWTGNSEAVIAYVTSLKKINTTTAVTTVAPSFVPKAESITKTSATTQATESSTVRDTTTQANNKLPDYILLGTISSITQDADNEPIQDTNKITSQYNIDISIDYQVIGTKDNAVVASFNAYGHANDVKILNNIIQKQNHNIPLLISQASKDLANNVLSQLQQQFSVSNKTYNIESITNLKIYN